jgi:molybdate transport system permease protein
MKNWYWTIGVGGMAAVMLLLFALPLVALVGRGWVGLAEVGWQVVWPALRLSLQTTAVVVLLALVLGTPLAYVLARWQFRGKWLLSLLVEMPIVMPPVVAGLALLAAFGRRGLVGVWLVGLGVQIPFTVTAVVLAQLFVSAPFYIRTAQARFSTLSRDLEEAASMDGASTAQIFWHVTLPLSRSALGMGLALCWARALGEFGATILFAGNLAGRTQTMPLLVYGALERDLTAAYTAALVLLGLAAAVLAFTRWLAQWE